MGTLKPGPLRYSPKNRARLNNRGSGSGLMAWLRRAAGAKIPKRLESAHADRTMRRRDRGGGARASLGGALLGAGLAAVATASALAGAVIHGDGVVVAVTNVGKVAG